jgi:hypothetical protein
MANGAGAGGHENYVLTASAPEAGTGRRHGDRVPVADVRRADVAVAIAEGRRTRKFMRAPPLAKDAMHAPLVRRRPFLGAPGERRDSSQDRGVRRIR